MRSTFSAGVRPSSPHSQEGEMSADEHASHQERFPRTRLLVRATLALGRFPEGT
jgi:hypothetical protein